MVKYYNDRPNGLFSAASRLMMGSGTTKPFVTPSRPMQQRASFLPQRTSIQQQALFLSQRAPFLQVTTAKSLPFKTPDATSLAHIAPQVPPIQSDVLTTQSSVQTNQDSKEQDTEIDDIPELKIVFQSLCLPKIEKIAKPLSNELRRGLALEKGIGTKQNLSEAVKIFINEPNSIFHILQNKLDSEYNRVALGMLFNILYKISKTDSALYNRLKEQYKDMVDLSLIEKKIISNLDQTIRLSSDELHTMAYAYYKKSKSEKDLIVKEQYLVQALHYIQHADKSSNKFVLENQILGQLSDIYYTAHNIQKLEGVINSMDQLSSDDSSVFSAKIRDTKNRLQRLKKKNDHSNDSLESTILFQYQQIRQSYADENYAEALTQYDAIYPQIKSCIDEKTQLVNIRHTIAVELFAEDIKLLPQQSQKTFNKVLTQQIEKDDLILSLYKKGDLAKFLINNSWNIDAFKKFLEHQKTVVAISAEEMSFINRRNKLRESAATKIRNRLGIIHGMGTGETQKSLSTGDRLVTAAMPAASILAASEAAPYVQTVGGTIKSLGSSAVTTAPLYGLAAPAVLVAGGCAAAVGAYIEKHPETTLLAGTSAFVFIKEVFAIFGEVNQQKAAQYFTKTYSSFFTDQVIQERIIPNIELYLLSIIDQSTISDTDFDAYIEKVVNRMFAHLLATAPSKVEKLITYVTRTTPNLDQDATIQSFLEGLLTNKITNVTHDNTPQHIKANLNQMILVNPYSEQEVFYPLSLDLQKHDISYYQQHLPIGLISSTSGDISGYECKRIDHSIVINRADELLRKQKLIASSVAQPLPQHDTKADKINKLEHSKSNAKNTTKTGVIIAMSAITFCFLAPATTVPILIFCCLSTLAICLLGAGIYGYSKASYGIKDIQRLESSPNFKTVEDYNKNREAKPHAKPEFLTAPSTPDARPSSPRSK
jgi:hypothetical protein